MNRPRIFYGYWIILAAFFCLFFFSGTGVYGFSLFVVPLQDEFGWNRAEIMLAFTVLFIIIGTAGPFVGRIIDKRGARPVVTFGAVSTALGYFLLSQMSELWHYYAAYFVIGIGMASIGFVPSTALITNWFKKRRGLALGLMSTGIGVGGIVNAPIIGGVIIPNFGWRAAYLALSITIAVILIPMALFVVRTRPSDMGLHPDGIAPQPVENSSAPAAALSGIPLKAALSTSAFYLICLTFLFSHFAHLGVIQNQVPYLEDIGFPVAMAATALGATGLMSAVGKLVFGWVCDHMYVNYAMAIGLVLQAGGIVSLILISGPDSPPILIWLYAILLGIGMGAWLPSMSLLVSRNFGVAEYGAIFGAVTFAHGIGSAFGPLTAGYFYDIQGTYHFIYIVMAALYLVAIPAVLLVRKPKVKG